MELISLVLGLILFGVLIWGGVLHTMDKIELEHLEAELKECKIEKLRR